MQNFLEKVCKEKIKFLTTAGNEASGAAFGMIHTFSITATKFNCQFICKR